jgi:uncharacterized membrane protein
MEMNPRKGGTAVCQICGKSYLLQDVVPGRMVRSAVAEVIRRERPEWLEEGYICPTDLNRYRSLYVEDVLEREKGELTELEEEVVRSLREHELLTQNLNREFERGQTVGERVADMVASFGGSWRFILLFGAVMAIWIGVNTAVLVARPFDPYPFILLNLVLSCLAAIQAPVIMMSQNRQESKDRLRAEHDYQVNLKAELEIRHLNAKVDLLLTHQWHQLLEIQEVQTELIQQLVEGRREE